MSPEVWQRGHQRTPAEPFLRQSAMPAPLFHHTQSGDSLSEQVAAPASSAAPPELVQPLGQSNSELYRRRFIRHGDIPSPAPPITPSLSPHRTSPANPRRTTSHPNLSVRETMDRLRIALKAALEQLKYLLEERHLQGGFKYAYDRVNDNDHATPLLEDSFVTTAIDRLLRDMSHVQRDGPWEISLAFAIEQALEVLSSVWYNTSGSQLSISQTSIHEVTKNILDFLEGVRVAHEERQETDTLLVQTLIQVNHLKCQLNRVSTLESLENYNHVLQLTSWCCQLMKDWKMEGRQHIAQVRLKDIGHALQTLSMVRSLAGYQIEFCQVINQLQRFMETNQEFLPDPHPRPGLHNRGLEDQPAPRRPRWYTRILCHELGRTGANLKRRHWHEERDKEAPRAL